MHAITRRGFLQALGLGAAAVVLPSLPEPDPELLEPRRKLWAVPSNAPVGSRIERAEDAFWKPFDAQVEGLMRGGDRYREMQMLYGDGRLAVVADPLVKPGEAWLVGSRGIVGVKDIVDNTGTLFAVDAPDRSTWRGQRFAPDSGVLTRAKLLRAAEKMRRRERGLET